MYLGERRVYKREERRMYLGKKALVVCLAPFFIYLVIHM